MKAIILAAGQGTRLRPLTDDRPKCLVPFRGRPIIEHLLATLHAGGVEDVTIVTGYRADRLDGMGTRTRHNARFAKTNMVHSLFCAEDQLTSDVVVSYADIVYSTRVLSTLLDHPGPFAVVVDRCWRDLWSLRMADPLAGAETMRIDRAGNIVELGRKPQSYSDIQGQYIGLFKIAGRIVEAVRDFYHDLDRAATYDGMDFDHMYMTSFIQAVADALTPVQAVLVEGGWVEIDSLEDLAAYERHEPEIRARLS